MRKYKGKLSKLIGRAIKYPINNITFNYYDSTTAKDKIEYDIGCAYIFIIQQICKKLNNATEDDVYNIIKNITSDFNRKAVLNEFNLNSNHTKTIIVYNDLIRIRKAVFNLQNNPSTLSDCVMLFHTLLVLTCKFSDINHYDLMYNILKRKNHEN